MSAEAVRELRLKITYEDAASGPSKAFHDAEKARIKATGDEQRREEQSYLKAMAMKLRAEKDLERAALMGAREVAREKEQLNRQLNALIKGAARDEARLAKDVARERIRADKDALQQWKAGHDARTAQAMDGWREEQAAIKATDGEIAGMIKTAVGLGAVYKVAGAIGNEFEKAHLFVERTAHQFADLRKNMQQVAALRGETNSSKFTVGQAEEAAKAGLMPEEWTKAQEEFQSRGGAYLEGDQARLDQKQGADYEGRIAAFAKARGIDPAEAMSLGGGLLQFSEGKQDVDKLMGRYGRVFKTLERAPTPVAQLLPQMNRIQSQGFSPEEAAQSLAIMSEAMPGEEQTGVENSLKAITAARLKGKGNSLGLKDGMTPMQQIEAAARTLQKKADAGEDVDKLMKEFAPDMRERRGLLGFMSRGVKSGGFERVRGYAAETKDDFTATATRDYRKSEEGQAAQRRANFALSEIRRGARNDPIEQLRIKARTDLNNAGAFERVSVADTFLGNVPIPGVANTQDQQVNRRAIGLARRRLGEGLNTSDGWASMSNAGTDDRLRELLGRLEAQAKAQTDELKKQTAVLEQQGKGRPEPMPMANPPHPRGR